MNEDEKIKKKIYKTHRHRQQYGDGDNQRERGVRGKWRQSEGRK